MRHSRSYLSSAAIYFLLAFHAPAFSAEPLKNGLGEDPRNIADKEVAELVRLAQLGEFGIILSRVKRYAESPRDLNKFSRSHRGLVVHLIHRTLYEIYGNNPGNLRYFGESVLDPLLVDRRGLFGLFGLFGGGWNEQIAASVSYLLLIDQRFNYIMGSEYSIKYKNYSERENKHAMNYYLLIKDSVSQDNSNYGEILSECKALSYAYYRLDCINELLISLSVNGDHATIKELAREISLSDLPDGDAFFYLTSNIRIILSDVLDSDEYITLSYVDKLLRGRKRTMSSSARLYLACLRICKGLSEKTIKELFVTVSYMMYSKIISGMFSDEYLKVSRKINGNRILRTLPY